VTQARGGPRRNGRGLPADDRPTRERKLSETVIDTIRGQVTVYRSAARNPARNELNPQGPVRALQIVLSVRHPGATAVERAGKQLDDMHRAVLS